MIKSQKGQATVELAFSLVILIIFLFGIIDFGRMFHTYLTLEHAGREAARMASLGAKDSEVIERAKASAASLTANDIIVSISSSSESRERGSYVTVNLSYPLSFTIPMLQNLSPNSFTLKSETVMRLE